MYYLYISSILIGKYKSYADLSFARMDPTRKLRGEMLRELNKKIGKKEFSSLLYMAGECISRITADDLSEEEDLWKFWKEIENAG